MKAQAAQGSGWRGFVKGSVSLKWLPAIQTQRLELVSEDYSIVVEGETEKKEIRAGLPKLARKNRNCQVAVLQ